MKKRKITKKKKMPQAKIYNYVAVFDSAEEGGYNVSFPAFPGCVTFGNSLSHAKRMAKEALELWIEELLSQKKRLPPPLAGGTLEKIGVAVQKG